MSLDLKDLMDVVRVLAADTSTDPTGIGFSGKNGDRGLHCTNRGRSRRTAAFAFGDRQLDRAEAEGWPFLAHVAQ